MSEAKKPSLQLGLDLLEKSINEWWKNIKLFSDIYLKGLLYLVLSVIVMLWSESLSIGGFGKILTDLISFIALLFFFYFYLRITISFFLVLKESYHKKGEEVFKESEKYLWPYLYLTLLTTILLILWMLLLIVPALIFSVYYTFVFYVFFFEGKRGMDAIHRSVRLVKGNWWAILWRIVIFQVVWFIFYFIISTPMRFMAEGTLIKVIFSQIITLISLYIAPIYLIYAYYLYKDLVKIRKYKVDHKK